MTSNLINNNKINNNNIFLSKFNNNKTSIQLKLKSNQKGKRILKTTIIRKMMKKILKKKTFIFAAKNANQISNITIKHVYVLFQEAKEESSLLKEDAEFVAVKVAPKKTRIIFLGRLKIKKEKYLENDQQTPMSLRTLKTDNIMRNQEILIISNTQVLFKNYSNSIRSMLLKQVQVYLKEQRVI